ncbi:MAG: DUF4091 domain-containing protein [Dysgonamonadaceae bacterium]|jgi:hypothetical protein|nr:DUF4091 domain-containing protein [Dysgonamonadaceae bacterium]
MKYLSIFNSLRYVFILSILTVHAGTLPGQTVQPFVEAPDPAPAIAAEWDKIAGGLHASVGSIDVRYPKSTPPSIARSLAWEGCAWRGERISAQVVLWSKEEVEQIECEFSPFRSKDADLPAGIARARFVRYVLTDVFEPGCGHRKPEDFPLSLSADMLDTLTCFNLQAQSTRPVWLSFDIPHDAKAGIYKGSMTIHARNREPYTVSLTLEVVPQTLPKPEHWTFHLDLWQHPSAVARVHGVKPWSEEHWALLEAPMEMLAAAGQKAITATVNKDPWNHQCYDAYDDMIAWTRQKDGTWEYNYTVFDRWVELMMRLGIRKEINCYSMIPWNSELHYYDAGKGRPVNVQAAPGTKTFEEMWSPFLQDFRNHLKEKGWLEITNIAMDERSPEDMQATLDFLHKTAPEIGVALADNHKSYRLFPTLKDVCVSFGDVVDESDLAFRKGQGLVSTVYVCCSHKFPNVFTFSDPAEAAYIGWYASAAGFDGFLRWAYNSWTENPLTDSRFRTWPAGDTYIIYPGARSSIRFERLREGIQDFEKIRILREHYLLSPSNDAATKLAELNETLAKFNRTDIPETPCGEMLQRAKHSLNKRESLMRNN